jgi:predicted PurR-regulated permease PerM
VSDPNQDHAGRTRSPVDPRSPVDLRNPVDQRSPVEWMRWVPWVLATLIVLIAILIGAQIILTPLLASLALSYLLAPIVAWFERRGWKRPAATVLTLTTACLALALILIFILPNIGQQLSKSYAQAQTLLAEDRIASLQEKIKQISPQLSDLLDSQLKGLNAQSKQEQIVKYVIQWLQKGLFRLVDLTTSILDLFLIPFFVYYLLADFESMRRRFEGLVPARHRGVASGLLGQISMVVSSYVRSQLIIALVMGALYSLGFLSLRVPMAVLIGMLAGLLNFVPYLGTLTGVILSLSFAALDGAGPARLLGVLGVFALIQSIEGYYLTPKLLGSRLNLHPMGVLIGLMIGGNLFGLLGIILAVPVLAIAKVLLGFLEGLYQQTDFFRRPGFNLLGSHGYQLGYTEATPNGGLANAQPLILDESEPNPSRRTIITTSELRSRIRDQKPSGDD